ncbi:hypothetical protein J6590_017120, partial [Homalodisca vitripennis]
ENLDYLILYMLGNNLHGEAAISKLTCKEFYYRDQLKELVGRLSCCSERLRGADFNSRPGTCSLYYITVNATHFTFTPSIPPPHTWHSASLLLMCYCLIFTLETALFIVAFPRGETLTSGINDKQLSCKVCILRLVLLPLSCSDVVDSDDIRPVWIVANATYRAHLYSVWRVCRQVEHCVQISAGVVPTDPVTVTAHSPLTDRSCLKCDTRNSSDVKCVKCRQLIILGSRQCVESCPPGYSQEWSTLIDYMGKVCRADTVLSLVRPDTLKSGAHSSTTWAESAESWVADSVWILIRPDNRKSGAHSSTTWAESAECVESCPPGYSQEWSTLIDYMGRVCRADSVLSLVRPDTRKSGAHSSTTWAKSAESWVADSVLSLVRPDTRKSGAHSSTTWAKSAESWVADSVWSLVRPDTRKSGAHSSTTWAKSAESWVGDSVWILVRPDTRKSGAHFLIVAQSFFTV